MRLAQITEKSIFDVSNRELLNLHYRIHQLYRLSELKQSKIDSTILTEKHSIVVAKMKNRNIRHTTNLEHAIEALFV